MYLSKELLFLLANNRGGIVVCTNNFENIKSYELSTTSNEPTDELIKYLKELGCYRLLNKSKSDKYNPLHKSINVILDKRLKIMIIVVFYNINEFLYEMSNCSNFIEYLYNNMIGLPLYFQYDNIYGKKGKVEGASYFVNDYIELMLKVNNVERTRELKSDITRRVIQYYSDWIDALNM